MFKRHMFIQTTLGMNPMFFFLYNWTDWIGTATDSDILDAILLSAKRIGHGFALHGHPEFLRMVKERNIAIEVNPISNQVLMKNSFI